MFDKVSAKQAKELEKKMYNANKKNQQVKIDKDFLRGERQKKKEGERLEKEMFDCLNPIKTLVNKAMINESLEELEILSNGSNQDEFPPTPVYDIDGSAKPD